LRRWYAAGLSVLALVALGGAPAAAQPASAPSWASYAAAWQAAAKALDRLQSDQRAALSRLWAEQAALARTEAARRQVADRLARQQAALATVRQRLAALGDARRRDVARATVLLRTVEFLGPTSFLGVLLSAQSWPGFLHRANAVAATLHRLDGRLRSLERDRVALATLVRREADVTASLRWQERRLAAVSGSLGRQTMALQATLAALGSEAASDEVTLTHVETTWKALFTPSLAAWQTAFDDALAAAPATFPATVAGGPGGPLTVTVPETGLDQWLAATPGLDGLTFTFGPDEDVLRVPAGGLAITGRFVVAGPTAVAFRFETVRFAGLVVPPDLLGPDTGALRVDLAPVLAGLTIKDVAAQPGQLTVTVEPPGG
jgi:hypothetical protein